MTTGFRVQPVETAFLLPVFVAVFVGLALPLKVPLSHHSSDRRALVELSAWDSAHWV
jgi:hypothetical protein